MISPHRVTSEIPGIDQHPDLKRAIARELLNSGCSDCDLGNMVKRYASLVAQRNRLAAEKKDTTLEPDGPRSSIRRLPSGKIASDP